MTQNWLFTSYGYYLAEVIPLRVFLEGTGIRDRLVYTKVLQDNKET